MSEISKLALGTAQLGMNYGLTNKSGKVNKVEAFKILENAYSNGIMVLDTASSYGSSEKLIGEFGNNKFQVCTKIKINDLNTNDINLRIKEEVFNSLKNLKIDNLQYCLIHDIDFLCGGLGNEIWSALAELKKKQVIKKVGYSIYAPDDLDKLYDKYTPDIIQTPFNILDQRIKQTGWLKILSEDKVEIHARSVFLQGVLLSELSELPSYFSNWSDVWLDIDDLCEYHNLSRLELLLAVASNEKKISKIIVGVTSNAELDQIFEACKKTLDIPVNYLPDIDNKLIDPRRWPSK